MLRLALIALIAGFVSNLGVGVYYFRYIVGNEGLMGVTAAATILALPVMFFVPLLSKKFSIARLTLVGYGLMAVNYVIYFLAGANIPLLMLAIILSGIGSLPASYLGPMLQLDCATYNEYQGYERMEGTLGSIKGVASRIGRRAGRRCHGCRTEPGRLRPQQHHPGGPHRHPHDGQHRAAGALHRHHHPHGRLRSGQAHA